MRREVIRFGQMENFEMHKNLTLGVSVVCIGTMIFVATEELAHGKALSEVHLITGAPVTVVASVGSTSVLVSDFAFPNTISEAIHATSVPEETALRLGNLTNPSGDRPSGVK
jgi:hypothetical protein